MKGHILQGPLGCPLKKFQGVDGLGFMPDTSQSAITVNKPSSSCCQSQSIKPLSWKDVSLNLLNSIKEWKEAGYPLVADDVYQERIKTCRNCPKHQYRFFQCKHCRCIVYTMAKLATKQCPFNLWKA